MKKIVSILLVIIAIFATSLSVNARNLETGPLSGNIGKYKIVMNLTFNSQNHTVSGWYYYKSKGSKNKISVSGTYYGDEPGGDLNLTEKVNGKVTGRFKGEFGFGNRVKHVTGTWSSPSGKTMEWYADNAY